METIFDMIFVFYYFLATSGSHLTTVLNELKPVLLTKFVLDQVSLAIANLLFCPAADIGGF